ncbi:sensor histidine kinase [Mammaliicoccus sp. I-M36]|uniref:sensor histidine kinase n=1 Tax=Mammaliicoccus sp. I-M36 TaxID=2898695 RepID=UPI001EFBEFD7|nr:sensor histidine kinase [Mammaliicoccus sp. I-M36]
MNKGKQILHFILRALKENSWFIITYMVIVSFIGSTFFLYDINPEIYLDTLLFTIPVVLIVFVYRCILLWRKHQLLLKIIQQDGILNLGQGFHTRGIIENDYKELLTKIEKQIDTLKLSHETQEKELKDYYSLWSHQIKTPLATLNLLAESVDSTIKKEMKEEIFKTQQYLDMMLQYLRLQSIQNDFRFEEVSLDRLVKTTLKKYTRFFISKDLEVELIDIKGKVITDEKWLQFILEQVIFNAIKYTKTGKITIYSPENNQQELRVKDTGQGILPEDLPRVFEKGYTGFNGRENEASSGLGLYMCKEIADQLGINLKITSIIDEGTEVIIDATQQLNFGG